MAKRRGRKVPPQSRMLDRPLQASAESRYSSPPTIKTHWSACPQCGASKLSVGVLPPVVTHTNARLETSDGGGFVPLYMRCRECGTRFTALRPD